ncbi:FAD dependent oxidoreductase [Myxozyma melibiosi]|uniref:FAD dependent oxidoreductase n=1 Tax=Myxozyma melibiosi TaxID=54550 RepID=A0ABR1FCW8_9ASCO
MAHPFTKSSRIAVVGSGEFGLSTAYYLLQAGYKSVTLFDRTRPPVPDGSSVDISRIVRADYDDPVYARMVVEALELWKTTYNDHYYPSGLLCMCPTTNPKYLADSLPVVKDLGLPVTEFSSGKAAADYLSLSQDALSGLAGYLSHEAGWVYAAKAVKQLFEMCLDQGAIFVEKAVADLIYAEDGHSVTGLKLEGGEMFQADVVIVACGAWTDTLVPTGERLLATGQPVAFVKLTEAEYEKYKHLPIYINFESGFYVFPPHPDSHLVKAARHSYGYTNYTEVEGGQRTTSVPPPVAYARGEQPLPRTNLPKDTNECIRIGLEQYLGSDIASRSYDSARVCWYTDTPTKDFLFDYKPGVKNLFVASGGSGHGLKFLPIIGKYAVGCFERSLDKSLLEKFSWREIPNKLEDKSRGGTPLMSLEEAEEA